MYLCSYKREPKWRRGFLRSMFKYIIKNGKCHKLFFRAWKWAKDKKSKIYPKKAKAFPISIEVDCRFCGCCE